MLTNIPTVRPNTSGVLRSVTGVSGKPGRDGGEAQMTSLSKKDTNVKSEGGQRAKTDRHRKG